MRGTKVIMYEPRPEGFKIIALLLQSFIAGEPDRFVFLQTGLLWILTPVKTWPYSEHISWYYVGVDGYAIDLRVVAIEMLILVMLMIVLPMWSRRRGWKIRSWVAPVTGLLFSMGITTVSPFAGASPQVSFVCDLGTIALLLGTIRILTPSVSNSTNLKAGDR